MLSRLVRRQDCSPLRSGPLPDAAPQRLSSADGVAVATATWAQERAACDAVVRCRDVALHYRVASGTRRVLEDVTCAVRAGEAVAVAGPSGSGKTSLLHLLAGLEHATTGRVDWPVLAGIPADRPGTVSLAFQAPSLLAALNVVENVALSLLLAGVTEADARSRAEQMLARLQLEPVAGQLPEELSGGQAQRVALARALATRPMLLLADEPTGQVDSATAALLLDVLLAEACAAGTAVVVATHDPAVLERMSTRWTVADGRLHGPERG